MRFRSLAVAGWLALLALSAVALGVPGTQAADSPEVAVSVNGEPVDDGEWIVRPETTLSTTVQANAPIETVLVRINGEDVLEAHPGTNHFETTLEPADLHPRWNSIQVVATVGDGNLRTHRFHVYEDSLAPDIGLQDPISVEPGHRFPDQTELTRSNLTIRGTVEDVSTVQSFAATLTGNGQSIETTTLRNDSFALDTTLAPGNHTLSIVATDEYGNTARRFTRFRVTDDEAPSVRFHNWPNVTQSGTIRPTLIATDAVAVRSIDVQVSGQPDRAILEPTTKLLGANRTNVTRTVPIEFYHPGNHTVTVNVSDYAGLYTEATTTIRYDPVTPAERVAPEIAVAENRSGVFNGTRYHLEGTVANGSVVTVLVEAMDNETGRVTAYERVYDGEPRSRVEISRNLSLESGLNDIRITAEDSMGTVHERRLVVDTETARAYEPNPGPATADGTAAPSNPTTAQPTRVSVTELPPLTPVSGGTVPTSPALVVVAFGLVTLLALRGH